MEIGPLATGHGPFFPFFFDALSLGQIDFHYTVTSPKDDIQKVTASSKAIVSARKDEIRALEIA